MAEKDEEKGFFVLFFESFAGKYQLIDKEFVILPSRPMHELEILFSTREEKRLSDWLKAKLFYLEKDSIIKIKCKIPETKKLLKAEFLREIIPETMNYTVSTKYKTKSAS
jgi:hypothetical protein